MYNLNMQQLKSLYSSLDKTLLLASWTIEMLES